LRGGGRGAAIRLPRAGVGWRGADERGLYEVSKRIWKERADSGWRASSGILQ